VEPKQFTLFFNIHKSFSILKEDVEHAIDVGPKAHHSSFDDD